MEFALNMDVPKDSDSVFSILQVRPIADFSEEKSYDWKNVDPDKVLIYSESALGSGHISGVTDIVFVKEEAFDKSKTKEIAGEIGEVNNMLAKQGRTYILLGPGRWGSSDPWLGIPVMWNQISEAKVIVECGLKDFCIDPSQGTHFFQNITSLGIGYFTVNPFRGEGSWDTSKLREAETVRDGQYIRVMRFKSSPEIFIDAKRGRGVVCI